jgi:hypothetical protein
LRAVLDGLLQGLRDPAVPVQAAAACSLRLLIAAPGATDLLRPMLSNIISEYFRIMDEVESESVLSALQAIVEQFGHDIAPMASMMVARLVEGFRQYASAGLDDDEGMFNATQCLDTIRSILDAIEDLPDVYTPIEVVVLPMLHSLLNKDASYEFIDGAISIISFFTYFGDTISPNMWTVCGPLLQSLNDWAIDYLDDMMIPLLNFVVKGTSTFLQATSATNGQSMVGLLLSVVEKIFTAPYDEDDDSPRDVKCAASMLTTLITCSRDAQGLNEVMPQALNMTIQKLGQCVAMKQSKSVVIRLLEVIMGAVYYNPPMVLQILQSHPDPTVTKAVFGTLFDHLNDMEKNLTQRLIVLSFSSMLALPASTLPEVIRNNLQAMFKQVIRELVLIKEVEDEEEEEGEEGDDVDDDDDDDDEEDDDDDDDDGQSPTDVSKYSKALYVPDGGYDEEEDCVNAEDEAYREALETMDRNTTNKAKAAASPAKATEDAEDTDFLEGDPVDDEDEMAFVSPLEIMDVSAFFKSTLQSIQAQDPSVAQHLQQGLDDEDRQRFQDLLSQ